MKANFEYIFTYIQNTHLHQHHLDGDRQGDHPAGHRHP